MATKPCKVCGKIKHGLTSYNCEFIAQRQKETLDAMNKAMREYKKLPNSVNYTTLDYAITAYQFYHRSNQGE